MIPEKYISALEKSDFSSLPADVYVHGFLKSLEGVYELDPGILIAQYRKEVIFFENDKKTQISLFSRGGFWKRFIITPKIISLTISILFFLGVFFYVVLQVARLNKQPELVITEPKPGQTISGTYFKIHGKTDAGSSVSLNGKPVFVSPDGSFTSELALIQGSQELSVESTSRLGKQSKVVIPVIIKQP